MLQIETRAVDQRRHFAATLQQRLDQVASQETGTAGDQAATQFADLGEPAGYHIVGGGRIIIRLTSHCGPLYIKATLQILSTTLQLDSKARIINTFSTGAAPASQRGY